MSLPGHWTSATSPEALFLDLWREAASWTSHRRNDCEDLAQEAQDALVDALFGASAAGEAVDAVRRVATDLSNAIFVTSAVQAQQAQDSLVLGGMTALDDVFSHIHPRSVRLSGALLRRRLPAWLQNAEEMRTVAGAYLEDAHLRVLPRGPLSRQARSVADANADTLTHRFNYLTAAPVVTALDDHQPVVINCLVVGHSAARGVPSAAAGKEVVGFAPLAEADADLVYNARSDAAGRARLDVRVAAGTDLADRLVRTVARLGAVDLLVAPELTLDEAASQAFAKALDPTTAPRLSIAGSGPSGAPDEQGRQFNASRAYNAMGAELWSHEKVWPYGMASDQVDQCHLGVVAEGEMLMEDIQSGASVTVADVDGFGRVLVLICQDLQIKPAVAAVVRTYQPDWVVVPILDRNVSTGRWMHKAAFDMSDTSPARFVVVTSLALAERSGCDQYPDTPVALMVGPAAISQIEKANGGVARALAVLPCTETDPMCGKAQWNDRSATWEKRTSLGSA